MKHKIFEKILSLLVIFALLAAMALTFTACTEEDTPTPDTKAQTNTEKTTASSGGTSETEEPVVLGEGATQISVKVVFKDGSEKSFTVNTDKENVADALVEVELIAGDDSQYGLYIKTVAGETLDWDKDGKFWAFYVDGEKSMVGASSTSVTVGATYTFRAE